MIDKTIPDCATAVRDVADGATIMVGGFGSAGQPVQLIDALIDQGASGLTIISNNAGNGDVGLARLIQLGRVRKVVCSFPRQTDSWHFDAAFRAGSIELELVPQGNLAERIRAAGAGIPAFYTATGVGTDLYRDAETRIFEDREYVLVPALHADLALVQGFRGDRLGNTVFRKTSRNFGPPMAAAAARTIVQVDEIVDVGNLDPESVALPGIYVDTVVAVGWRPWMPGGVFAGGIVGVDGQPVLTPADAEGAR